MARVLVAVQEAGAAQAVAPVIRALASHQGLQVVVAACAQALRVLSQHQIATRPVTSLDGYATTARALLREVDPDVLLLGTAWGPSLDKALLWVAQQEQIPSVSIVDMWSNYRERFIDPHSGAFCLPTKVAVIDATAYDQAVRVGIPSDRLVITGQPHLESLPKRFQDPLLHRQGRALRREWLGDDPHATSTRLVLFASEPFALDFGPMTPYDRGFTETEALEALVEAVQWCERRHAFRAVIVCKLHPTQLQQSVELGPLAVRRQVQVVADQPPWPCIVAADVIAGMESIFLIESSLAGKPTIRVHLDEQRPDVLAGSPIEWLPRATSAQELTRLLSGTLTEPSAINTEHGGQRERWAHLAVGGAASNIAALTLGLAGAAYGPAVRTPT